jgi:hypothetical protein
MDLYVQRFATANWLVQAGEIEAALSACDELLESLQDDASMNFSELIARVMCGCGAGACESSVVAICCSGPLTTLTRG